MATKVATAKIIAAARVPGVQVYPDAPGKVVKRDLVGKRDHAPNFAMRLFEVAPGGATAHHRHAWEHEVFILEGAGQLLTDEGPKPFAAGSAVFVPGDTMHQFQNTSRSKLKFICVIPNSGDT
ncbi:MAG: cupin domain-containing protein [Actinobacteria bacterium]|nr:cupin domain-containing protein [Actinomycetota bacterium]